MDAGVTRSTRRRQANERMHLTVAYGAAGDPRGVIER